MLVLSVEIAVDRQIADDNAFGAFVKSTIGDHDKIVVTGTAAAGVGTVQQFDLRSLSP